MELEEVSVSDYMGASESDDYVPSDSSQQQQQQQVGKAFEDLPAIESDDHRHSPSPGDGSARLTVSGPSAVAKTDPSPLDLTRFQGKKKH